TLLAAAEALGVAERTLEDSVEYAKVRQQFGRPIGSFQAVKHRCADMAVRAEVARSLTTFAAVALAEGEAAAPRHVAAAKVLATARRLQALVVRAPGPGQAGRFLTAHELDTLRAVTARFVPGPPDDPDPGALEAGVAEAIDLLLAAFTLDPPLIHAGGPFSDRAGATHDDFADFVPLDAPAALGCRIRLEGSHGLPEREFAGPVTGLQEIYRSGLAHLDE